MIKVGDIVTETLFCDSVDGIAVENRGPREGRVVYIHPKHRFYRVEFTTPLGYRWRECFYFPDRSGNAEQSKARLPGRSGGWHRSAMPGTSPSDMRLY